MDVDLTLDEIIERKRITNPAARPSDKKLHAGNLQMKTRKPIHKPAHQRSYDARNKIIQKTRAKIVDARDILNQNIRDSGVDARNVLIERKKERMPLPMPLPPPTSRSHSRVSGPVGDAVHKGRFGQRIITMSNRPGGSVQTFWDPKDEPLFKSSSGGSNAVTSYQSSRLNAGAKPFVPRGYVDYDNMQQQEDEEISRSMHLGSSYKSQHPVGPRPRMTYGFDGYDIDMDDVEVKAPHISGGASYAMYESARNRTEHPKLSPPGRVGHGDNGGEKMFDRRQRSLVATSNLPDSLRARLFGGEPDRRVSHGIYANENGSDQLKVGPGLSSRPTLHHSHSHPRRSPPSLSMSMTLPLSVVNNKPGYRLLVSNLHSNVTTSDIRELFSDIGPMYDAHVVRPGTAEVIYKSLEHAEMAVDAYHQREFDNQPMHCVLVNPHSSNRASHSASSRTVTTNSSGVEVDIDALHSVLFRDR